MNPIVIVGLGLIGGSLAAACRKAFPRARMIGVTRSRTALAAAKKKGWIHAGYRNLADAFGKGRDGSPTHERDGSRTVPALVVLCTPVDTLKNFLTRLDRIAPPGTVVTDTGSVKGSIVRWADGRRWQRIQFVGAHPMAGSHERGIEHARGDLFKDSLTFVTPGRLYRLGGAAHASPLQIVKQFWKKISRRVVTLSPEPHDRFTAEVSHLPHFLASWLVASVSPKALRFAAAGFFDTTRVAQGSPDLWAPIFLENRRELLRALEKFETALGRAKRILRRKEISKLRRALRAVQARRSSLNNSG